MGKKYIVEMKEGERLYKTKLNALNEPVIREIICEPYTEPDLEQTRKEGYENGVIYGRMCEREKIFKTLEKFSDGDTDIDCLTMGDFRTIMELSKRLQKMKETDND